MAYEKETLTKEYTSMYNTTVSQVLQFSGYCRYRIKKNEIEVNKSLETFIKGTLMIILINLTAVHVMTITGNIHMEERLLFLQINLSVNYYLVDMTYARTYTGSKVLKQCVNIDHFLGSEETKFMRDVTRRSNRKITLFILFFQLSVVIGLNVAFPAKMPVRFTGSLYFLMCFFNMYDAGFVMTLYINLNLRIRYLNTALMKIVNMNLDCLPKISRFDGSVWKSSFWNQVRFQQRAETKEYLLAYKMVFDNWHLIQRMYRFSILISTLSVIVNSLLVAHTLLKYTGTEGMSIVRFSCIFFLFVLSWIRLMGNSQQSDMVLRHIEQTKVICVCALLKPSNSVTVFELTSRILKMCEFREQRPSVYGLFHLDTGMVLRVAASIFVYITVLMQTGLSVSVPKGASFDNVPAPNNQTLL